MKNLKRTLSLVLAVALCFSLLAVGASARVYKDESSVTYKEAVQWLSTLGVLNGEKNDDGTYNLRPTDPITRAEFAKLVCFVLNGGTEPSLAASGVTSFTDTKGHWAASYIEFLVSLGYISGYGDGTFGPNDTITGQQAAKILLTVLGYNAQYEGLVGPNWAFKTDALANTNGLYNKLVKFTTSNLLKREEAAQIIWNATLAYVVSYDTAGTVGNKVVRSTTQTPLTIYFNVVLKEGLLVKNAYGDISTVGGVPATDGVVTIKEFNSDGTLGATITFDKDNTTGAMLGQSVRFAYQTSAVAGASKKTLVGDIVVTDYSKSYTTTAGGKIKDSTTGMTLDTDLTVTNITPGALDGYSNRTNTYYTNYKTKIVANYSLVSNDDHSNTGTTAGNSSAYRYQLLLKDTANNYNYFSAGTGWVTQFIDYNGDGTCDYIKYFTSKPYKVTNTTSSTVTLKDLTNGSTISTYDASKAVNLEDGSKATLKIGDIILAFIDPNGKIYVEKSSSFTGTVGGVKASQIGPNVSYTVTVDGTAYKLHDASYNLDGCGLAAEGKVDGSGSVGLNTQATFYKDQYNNIFYIDETTVAALNIKFGLVTFVDSYSFSAKGQYVEMVKDDGTKVSALVKQIVTKPSSSFVTTNIDANSSTQLAAAGIGANTMIAYTTASDGSLKVYRMPSVSAYAPASGTVLNIDNDAAKIGLTSGGPNPYASYFTSADTVFVDVTNNLGFTGWANTPDVQFNSGSSMYVVTQSDAYNAQSALNGGSQSGSSYYVVALFYAGGDAQNSGKDIYFYIPTVGSKTQYYNSNNDLVNTFTAFVNGVSKSIDILNSAYSSYVNKTLYKVKSFDSDGKTVKTLTKVVDMFNTSSRTTTLTTRVAYIDKSSITLKTVIDDTKDIDLVSNYTVVATYLLNSSTVYMDLTAASGQEFMDREAVLQNYTVYVVADSDNVALQVYIANKATSGPNTGFTPNP